MPKNPWIASTRNQKKIIETVFDPDKQKTSFAVYDRNGWTEITKFTFDEGITFVPLPANNKLIQTKTILLAQKPVPYESKEELISNIQKLIHRYMDLTPTFELIATYYVLLSWVFDSFNELPYLRVRGAFGSGKTRFLQVIGSLCYRPIFGSGASTVAPIFHILDKIGGTLLLDEADFRFSDGTSEIVKILNNGNAKGMSVLRCISPNGKTFEPTAYNVFGPKIVASKSDFDDEGLESRFLTEDLGRRNLRGDIPVSLPQEFHSESLQLRNKLLSYRGNFSQSEIQKEVELDSELLPRARQIFTPLLALITNDDHREVVIQFLKDANAQLMRDQGQTVEAHVLAAILRCKQKNTMLTIGNIAVALRTAHGNDYDRKVTPHWVGYIVRRQLHLSTRKSNGVYVIDESQQQAIEVLCARYDVDV